MQILRFGSKSSANTDATERLAAWLVAPDITNIIVAGGNTPLELYQRITERNLNLAHLNVFALDEYVAVPLENPRNCANLLRVRVATAWKIPEGQFFTISSVQGEALASVQHHERLLREKGGADVVVLGLGENGHLGFNEPGSTPDSEARVVDLDTGSVEANRRWFDGAHAPAQGATLGLRSILSARRILVMAYGPHKRAAVRAMAQEAPGSVCPASFLQTHPETWLYLDEEAAHDLPPGLQPLR